MYNKYIEGMILLRICKLMIWDEFIGKNGSQNLMEQRDKQIIKYCAKYT